jgi:hypothetical protein
LEGWQWSVSFILVVGMLMVAAGVIHAETRVESSIIDHCTSADLWRVERGKLSVDGENSASRGASIRIEQSGVYERVAPVEECVGFSWLFLPHAKQPVKLVGHLRDRNQAHYILETRLFINPKQNWTVAEFSLESAKLAPWSMDLNHRLDFPLHSIGLMVTLASGESLNIDNLTLRRAVGTTEEERVIREWMLSWKRKLAAEPSPEFRRALPSAESVTFSPDEETWVVTAPLYRATLSPHTGTFIKMEFGPRGAQEVMLHVESPWLAISWEGDEVAPGPVTSWDWEPKLKRLSVQYGSPHGVEGETRYLFRGRSIEMQLGVQNHSDRIIRWIRFPGRTEIPREIVDSVIWPRLGGVELLPSFFEQGRFSRAAYPADGFSDFVAFRMENRTLSLGTIQAGPFFQSAEPVVQGKPKEGTIAYLHDVGVFIPPNASWTLSPVFIWFTQRPEDALGNYREANGWEHTPDLHKKLGRDLFDRMSRMPLLKWDFDALGRHYRSGGSTFSEAGIWLGDLPGGFLIHPVSYWNPPGRGPKPDKIFDQNHPNFLPAADRFGGDAKFRQFLKETRVAGFSVAPYTNPTAWGKHAAGFEDYGEDIAILTEKGKPHWGWDMYSADPYHPTVRKKMDELVSDFSGSHRVDLLFEDQVGARKNYLNLRDRAPHPLAYTEGWIEHARTASRRLPLMTERGFDALIPYEAAFCGVELGLACTRYMKGWEWNGAYGEGNWRVFPLEVYLSHDKCALYHHDLGQFVLSDFDLAWCLVKGYNLQMHYPGEEKWIKICHAFQEAVGPTMFGEPLRSFEYLTDYVVQSRFPGLKVVANFHPDADWYMEGNHSIPPNGLLVVGDGGRLCAGVVKHFHGLSLAERRYVIESHVPGRIVFRDVLPSGQSYRLSRHGEWPKGSRVRGEALTVRGRYPLEVKEVGSVFEFEYPPSVGGDPVIRTEFRAEPIR